MREVVSHHGPQQPGAEEALGGGASPDASGRTKAERSILAALLTDPRGTAWLKQELNPDDFADQRLRQIARNILEKAESPERSRREDGEQQFAASASLSGEAPDMDALVAELALGEEALHVSDDPGLLRAYLDRIREEKMRERWKEIQPRVTNLINRGQLRRDDPLFVEYEALKRRFAGSGPRQPGG